MSTAFQWAGALNYHAFMSETRRFPGSWQVTLRHRVAAVGVVVTALACMPLAHAESPPTSKKSPIAVATSSVVNNSQVTALAPELVYLVLVGEMQLQAGQAGAGYSFMLEAARQSGEPSLYRRAIQIALQSRSGQAATDAAKAWAISDRTNTEPLRVQLQILLSQNLVGASTPALEALLDGTPDEERNDIIDLIGAAYSRVNDPTAALQVLTNALRLWQRNSGNASSSWAALSRVQSAAGMADDALQSMEKALDSPPVSESTTLLAIDMLDATPPLDEKRLQQLLQQNPTPLLKLAYTRHLLGASRWADAVIELRWLTTNHPDTAEPWLLLGALQLQNGEPTQAEPSFEQFLKFAHTLEDDRRAKATKQAYLSLALIAEQRQQFDHARQWLDQISADERSISIQLRYAGLLSREGRLNEAIALMESTAATTPAEIKSKWLALAQLLKDDGQLQAALQHIASALEAAPNDTDVLLEQSLLEEKMGQYENMERTLRRVIELSPDNAHAHNALGYSLADRSIRLSEAKGLIEKAMQLAPGDAFILDSLGWVQFRMGDRASALASLRQALELRADAEIATHLGEVLWTEGQTTEANAMFDRARTLQPNNETLQRTLERLKPH